jgi:hypothetical protein
MYSVDIQTLVAVLLPICALVVAGVVSAIAATVAERVPSGKAQPVEIGTEERKLAA